MSQGTTSKNRKNGESLDFRRAHPADHGTILHLLGALELGYPSVDLSCFWVAESVSGILAVAELKELRCLSLLSCVGVRDELQGQGIGRRFVEFVVLQTRLPVYLYTLVPDFFRKAGFRLVDSAPPELPPRSMYGCSGCDPSICACMVRTRDGS